MWLILFFITVAFFVLRRFAKRKSRVVKEEKTKSIPVPPRLLKTLEEIKETIPLFQFGSEEGEALEIPPGEEMDFLKPFFIEEGEFKIMYKGEEISRKGRGEVVFYTLFVMLKEERGLKCISTRRSRVVPIEKVNRYVLFSMVRKKCVEVATQYFSLEGVMIEKEEEVSNDRIEDVLKKGMDNVLLLKKNEVIKKKGDPLSALIFIHYGEIEVDGRPFKDVFGYFSLFFDVYRKVEIKATRETKVSLLDYYTLKKRGLDEEDLEVDFLRGLPDFFHLVDVSCDWRILVPDLEMVVDGFFLRDGEVVGARECLLGLKSTTRMSTTRVSEVITIPKGLVGYYLKEDPTRFHHLGELIMKNKTSSNSIVTVLLSELFTRRLKASLGKDCLLLTSKDVTEILSKKIFTVSEELRVMDFLKRMSKSYPVVLVYMENEYSRFLKYLLKYSTTCLLGEEDEVEEAYCQLEYIRLYETKDSLCRNVKGIGRKMDGRNVRDGRSKESRRKDTISHHSTTHPTTTHHPPISPFVHHVLSPARSILFDTKDFERLGRFLLGQRVGLVLSGGGARGIAHIGVIQALEEEGIPIDIIGGTSMGAFVGALYARGCDNGQVFRESKKFCNKARSIWPYIFDLTYPICSFFKGEAIDKSLRAIFKSKEGGLLDIRDLWLDYFCITTNLFTNDEEVHRDGPLWQYVRASMGICGYLPPVSDPKGFLVDGGYVNNVPADVMSPFCSLVLAVDIGTVLENDYDPYDHGVLAFFHRYFGTRKYLTLEEIQYRLAFLSTEKKIKDLENDPKIILIRPDLGDIKTMDFHRFDEIVATGYQSAKEIIRKWTTVHFKKRAMSRRRYSM